MFCKKCGQNVEGKKYCPNCGTRVEETPAPAQPRQNYGYPSSSYGNVERNVNKVAFALLAIFLGFLGLHRFYAGKTTSGVVYLISIFIGGIIITFPLSIVEGIVALTRPDDGYGNIPVYTDRYFV